MRYRVIVLTLLLLACVQKPAAANITSVTLSTMTPTYSGKCPTTITFKGTITGTNGTQFQYTWKRSINGVQQSVNGENGATITLFKMTSYSVTDPFPVNQTTGANTYDQLWVHNISGGQPDVSSMPPTSFSVSCFTLNPNVVNQANPGASGLKIPPGIATQLYVPPPVNLAQTGDQTLCGSHGAGFNCPIAMSNKWLALVWCWGPNACAPASTDQHVNSFNIYEVDSGKHARVATTNADQYGSLATAGFVHTPAGGFTNQCYAVSAVYGTTESSMSNAVCLGNGTTGTTTTALQSTRSGYRYDHYRHQGIGIPLFWPLDGSLDCNGCVWVGWSHWNQGGGDVTGSTDNAYWRGYYLFDLSSLSHHYINQATLTLSTQDSGWACVKNLGPADSDWWTIQGVSGGDFQPILSVSTSPTSAVLDVTSIVQAWANGAANHGFAMQGFNEDDVSARDNGGCQGWFNGNAVLTVTHS